MRPSSSTVGAPGFSRKTWDTPWSTSSSTYPGMSAVRVQTMAIMFPSGFGMSAMLAWKRTLPSCSFLKAANSAPPGPSAPPPRNQGSTMSVSVADGTSPSRICLAWYQPIPLPGIPHPTNATGVVEAARVASRRELRCRVRRASIFTRLL